MHLIEFDFHMEYKEPIRRKRDKAPEASGRSKRLDTSEFQNYARLLQSSYVDQQIIAINALIKYAKQQDFNMFLGEDVIEAVESLLDSPSFYNKSIIYALLRELASADEQTILKLFPESLFNGLMAKFFKTKSRDNRIQINFTLANLVNNCPPLIFKVFSTNFFQFFRRTSDSLFLMDDSKEVDEEADSTFSLLSSIFKQFISVPKEECSIFSYGYHIIFCAMERESVKMRVSALECLVSISYNSSPEIFRPIFTPSMVDALTAVAFTETPPESSEGLIAQGFAVEALQNFSSIGKEECEFLLQRGLMSMMPPLEAFGKVLFANLTSLIGNIAASSKEASLAVLDSKIFAELMGSWSSSSFKQKSNLSWLIYCVTYQKGETTNFIRLEQEFPEAFNGMIDSLEECEDEFICFVVSSINESDELKVRFQTEEFSEILAKIDGNAETSDATKAAINSFMQKSN